MELLGDWAFFRVFWDEPATLAAAVLGLVCAAVQLGDAFGWVRVQGAGRRMWGTGRRVQGHRVQGAGYNGPGDRCR